MKPNLEELVCDSLLTGAVATVATTAAIAACGRAEGQTAAAPLNAISHILYGDRAAKYDEARLDTTLPGALLNTAAMGLWAGVHELLYSEETKRHLPSALCAGAATAALAYFVDYYIVPKRFTPGFELRLSGGSLLAIYATLAGALALGPMLREAR